MDEKELNELVKQHIKKIDDEECDDGDCSTCERARDALRAEILEAEEAKKNEPEELLKMKLVTMDKTGSFYWKNDANTIAASASFESMFYTLSQFSWGDFSQSISEINDSPDLDNSYPIWAIIRDYVNTETPVQKIMYSEGMPLLVQTEGQVLAIAPEVKRGN